MSHAKDLRPKSIPVMLDKERNLLYDLNAFAEIEEHYGSIDEAMAALEKGSIKAVRVLLWAGLIHEELDEKEQPKITVRQVGSWIAPSMLQDIADKLGQAIGSAIPEEEEQGDEVPLAKKAN